MRMPFEKLMRAVATIPPDSELTLGYLAELYGEPVHRVMDAIDAVKVLNGETTYIEVGP